MIVSLGAKRNKFSIHSITLHPKALKKKKGSCKMNDNIYRVKALSNPLVYACITGLASLALRSTPEPAKPVPPCPRAKRH